MNKEELDFKRFVRGKWPHWSCAYEPGIGSNGGYPDLQLMEPKTNRLLPVELKVGGLKDHLVITKEVRPAQVVWHHNFHRAGGRAVLLVGVRDKRGNWDGFAYPGHWAEHWREGYKITDAFALWNDDMPTLLAAMVEYFLGV
jgi:hypothetical protein